MTSNVYVLGLSKKGVLTLTGAGGIGKSRLAWQVADRVADCFPDGVYAVELASVADHEQVVTAIARAAGLCAQPGVPVADTLVRADQFGHFDAIRLFAERAQSVDPEFK